jgi:hypothetical protein
LEEELQKILFSGNLPLDKILNFDINKNVKGAIKDERVCSYPIWTILQFRLCPKLGTKSEVIHL